MTPRTAACQASLSITNFQRLLKLMVIESMLSFNHLILCHPLLLLPSIFPSIRVFFSESVLHIRWSSIGVSVSASILPMNIQDWFPLGWTGWISFQSKGLSRVFSKTTVQKHQFFSAEVSLWSSSHTHTRLLEKPQLRLDRPLSAKECLWFLICCLGWSKLLSKEQVSLNLMVAIAICSDFRAHKNKVPHCFHCFLIYLPWSDGTVCHDLSFLNVEFKASFFTPFHFHKRLFRSSSLSAMRVVSSAYLRLLIFLLEILIPACTSSNRRIIYISVNGAESGDMVIHTELGA